MSTTIRFSIVKGHGIGKCNMDDVALVAKTMKYIGVIEILLHKSSALYDKVIYHAGNVVVATQISALKIVEISL